MKTIRAEDLSNFAMVAGKEKRIRKVIQDGILKEWVGIGWIVLRRATPSDVKRYARVV